MSASAAGTGAAGAGLNITRLMARNHFVLRRLHSLTGIVPVGAFVIFHLFTNCQLVLGADEFQHEVDFIHSLPGLPFLEVALVRAKRFNRLVGFFATDRFNVPKGMVEIIP